EDSKMDYLQMSDLIKKLQSTINKMAEYIAHKNPNCTHCDFKSECTREQPGCKECIIEVFNSVQ
ncbi:unnamed protein product, partial [marine sediment metagenome]